MFIFGPQQQKNLEGYVGFANLPNQVYRKSVKRGFEFTLMVVGEFFPFWRLSTSPLLLRQTEFGIHLMITNTEKTTFHQIFWLTKKTLPLSTVHTLDLRLFGTCSSYCTCVAQD